MFNNGMSGDACPLFFVLHSLVISYGRES